MSTDEMDVAFSFLSEDESTALRFAELLLERYDVFVYSERQKELAGKDGVEEFPKVFGARCRVCVVLYREGWGETKWTRIEETAIKERALEDGWDFLLVISLDGAAPPRWLPRTKLWYGFERFGIEAAIGAIDAKIQEIGGVPKEESAREQAKRLRSESHRKARIRETLGSQEGVNLAVAELDKMAEHLAAEATEIANGGTPIEFVRADRRVFYVRTPRRSVTFGWSQQFANSLQYSGLLIRVLDGTYHHEGWGEGPNEVARSRVKFDLDESDRPVWREEGVERPVTTRDLAEKYLREVVEGTYGPYLEDDHGT